jgi:hypothetical protein
MSTTTTEYGTWINYMGGSIATLEDTVNSVIGAFGKDFDADAISREYREAINAALPDGVTLNGNDFYGPADRPTTWGDYLVDEDGALDIEAIVQGIDLIAIVEKHDKS